MKEINSDFKPKNKGVSAAIIALSVVFFIASGILVFMSLYEGGSPFAMKISDDSPLAEGDVIGAVEAEDINPALNKAIISVVLDKYNTHTADSLKAQTCVVESTDSIALLESYTAYLDSLSVNGIRYNLLHGDYDNDGATEYYLYIYFPVKATFVALGDNQAYSDYINNAGGEDDSQGIIIYGDTYDGKTTFRAYYSGEDYHSVHNVSVNDGVMSVSFGSGVSEVYVVCTPYVVYENYAYQDEAFSQMCDSYASALRTEGYTEVYYYCADLSDAVGEETIFVFTDRYGKVNVRVVTFINGKIHYIYENLTEVCATYIVEIDSKSYLIEYSQSIGLGSEDYESNYFYRIFRFDNGYVSTEYNRSETTVKYGTVSAENESFFAIFNGYVANAVVLSDPYEITGYGSLTQSSGMSTHKDDNVYGTDTEQSYLNISNCSTSKQGIVNVPETSYLNFRNGPSVDFDKILIDHTDDDSYVRQLKGSSVTVVDTVNTGDEENPVWVKIQIKYNDLTLTGYSSQMWIDLPGIRHISVGDSLEITADTNENQLTWTCNDSSIASIDSSNGKLTARNPGLVLVTVTSESGLSDSCLIAID